MNVWRSGGLAYPSHSILLETFLMRTRTNDAYSSRRRKRRRRSCEDIFCVVNVWYLQIESITLFLFHWRHYIDPLQEDLNHDNLLYRDNLMNYSLMILSNILVLSFILQLLKEIPYTNESEKKAMNDLQAEIVCDILSICLLRIEKARRTRRKWMKQERRKLSERKVKI